MKPCRRLPETPERSKRELAIRIALLTPIIALKGYASPDMARAAAAARALADRVGEGDQLFPVMYGEWTSNTVRGNLPAARALAEQYLRLAKRQSDTTPLLVGHRMLGPMHVLHGGAVGRRGRTATCHPALRSRAARVVHLSLRP